MKKRLQIVSLDFAIRAKGVLNTSFDSVNTVLDADILVIEPGRLVSVLHKNAKTSGDGIHWVSTDHGSRRLLALFKRRQDEVVTLLRNGKVVLSFMSPRQAVSVQHSTSREEYVTLTNYGWVPYNLEQAILQSLKIGVGREIRLYTPEHPFAPFFQAFREELSYAAYQSREAGSEKNCFLRNRVGHPVGVSYQLGGGMLVLVPYLREDQVDPEKLCGVLVDCARPIVTKDVHTPPPEWAETFSVPGRADLRTEITHINERIAQEEKHLGRVSEQLAGLEAYKALLYEKGRPLEDVVIKAFKLMGFEADRLEKDDLEHDVVFKAPEGRGMAEVEGRDKDAIHIEKLDHLTRVVDETFNATGAYPEGVLIGNPYRLFPPAKRPQSFTDKVITAAKRKSFGLLTTVQLFEAVVRILETPSDESLKAKCRKAILEIKGQEIKLLIDS